MMSIDIVFWMYVLLVGFIGGMRGWAQELLVTFSAILALAIFEHDASTEEVWQAAHLEEDWTSDHWGEDREATERRATRWLDMTAAVDMLKALKA